MRRFAIPQQCDTRADAEPIAPGAFEAHLKPALPGPDIVVEETHGAVVVRHENIHGPVVVDIADRRATADIDPLERGPGDDHSSRETFAVPSL